MEIDYDIIKFIKSMLYSLMKQFLITYCNGNTSDSSISKFSQVITVYPKVNQRSGDIIVKN